MPAAFRADLKSLGVCFILLAFRELFPSQLFHVRELEITLFWVRFGDFPFFVCRYRTRILRPVFLVVRLVR